MNNSDEQYPYSRFTCQDACRNAVQRFSRFRHRVPSGFFVCRVLDVQVFTAATFLLLSEQSGNAGGLSGDSQVSVDPRTAGLVQQVIDCLMLLGTTRRDICGANLRLRSKYAYLKPFIARLRRF